MSENSEATRAIPEEIVKRVSSWSRMFNFASRTHYIVGIVGVGCSAMAAADLFSRSQILAAISAVCIAILGFAQPERKYMKFVRSWRLLDTAALKYKYGRIELDELLATLDRSEQLLSEIEQETLEKPVAAAPPDVTTVD